MKRLFDIVASTAALPVPSPVFAGVGKIQSQLNADPNVSAVTICKIPIEPGSGTE